MKKTKQQPCAKCGVSLMSYYLKDGICNGCRNPELVVRARLTATVKWFNDAKGYGFVAVDNGPDSVFAHYSAIEGEGFKTLVEGETVQVEILDGPKGPQCVKIVRNPNPWSKDHDAGPII